MSTSIPIPDNNALMDPSARTYGYHYNDEFPLPAKVGLSVLGVAGVVSAVALAVLGAISIVPAIVAGAISAVLLVGALLDSKELVIASFFAAVAATGAFSLGLAWANGYYFVPVVVYY